MVSWVLQQFSSQIVISSDDGLKPMYSRNFLDSILDPVSTPVLVTLYSWDSSNASKILLGFDVLSTHDKGGPLTPATVQTSRG